MPRSEVAFQIAGEPGPQGSRIPGRRKDDTLFTRPASGRGARWMKQVAGEAWVLHTQHKTLPVPYEIELFFWITKKRTSKLRWPSDDLDKLVRATLDGFTQGRLIEDDRFVIRLTAGKDFHSSEPGYGPGCEVKIIAGEEEDERAAA